MFLSKCNFLLKCPALPQETTVLGEKKNPPFFLETKLKVHGSPLEGQDFHLYRQRKALFPFKKTPIMGTRRICGTPPALTKIKHLAHAILSFYFQYHLQCKLFTKSTPFTNDMISPGKALKYPAVTTSVHKH